MKKFKKMRLLFAAVILTALMGCGKKENTLNFNEPNTIDSPEDDVFERREGMVKNDLTGEWIDESYKDKRPVAVMINNIIDAMPVSGVAKADIVYECIVEGNITRLLAIYTEYENVEKIGSVRSARPYYVDIANEYDAIYAHFGWSKQAEKMINKGAIQNINGLYSSEFFRDTSRVEPHNAYISGKGIQNGIEAAKYPVSHNASYSKKFKFYSTNTELEEGQTAKTVQTNFAGEGRTYFEYHEDDKLYYRFQYGKEQIDNQEAEGKQQLSYKNIIIQFATYSVIDAKKDLQAIDLVENGEGFYITNGKAIPITWKKGTDTAVTKYFKKDGEELMMNPGKTWITIFKDTKKEGIVFQ